MTAVPEEAIGLGKFRQPIGESLDGFPVSAGVCGAPAQPDEIFLAGVLGELLAGRGVAIETRFVGSRRDKLLTEERDGFIGLKRGLPGFDSLAAAAEGLATCWIGAFDPSELRKILSLPDGIEPLAITPVGYPDEAPRAFLRKPLSEIVHRERW